MFSRTKKGKDLKPVPLKYNLSGKVFHYWTRGYSFDLTREEFSSFLEKKCFYCNSPLKSIFSRKGDREKFFYNGIDRIDNEVGYKMDNVVTCCRICNFAKKDMHIDYFIYCIDQLVKTNAPLKIKDRLLIREKK